MVKLIFDIDDNSFEKIKCAYEGYFDCPISLKLCDATVLPTNATNGDAIKALFPNKQFVSICSDRIYDFTTDNKIDCDLDWWNAPYEV